MNRMTLAALAALNVAIGGPGSALAGSEDVLVEGAWARASVEGAEQLNVVFITVDPERDTAEAMAEYLGYFHAAIRSWTGPADQIARAADSFRASYQRVPAEGGDYTMNHTASVFLFDADGRFVSTIDYHEPREVAVPKIRRAINEEARRSS